MMICVAHDVSSQIKCARDCVSINRLLTLKVNPTTLDYGVSEVIPGELVGRWEGLQADVRKDGKVTASTPVELCATEGSPELNIKLNDDDASLEIQMIKQVVCTGLYLGYFFSGVQGKNQCNKFVLDPDSNDAELTLTSHYENKLYDCSPLDKLGSMLKIETRRQPDW
mmetsp:Transcript_26349/g.38943  ORF Transcript_26349/g.38943 Transcript_26349/m.38943 type:complete len:168 (-) Transcript_26349:940-1443(-)